MPLKDPGAVQRRTVWDSLGERSLPCVTIGGPPPPADTINRALRGESAAMQSPTHLLRAAGAILAVADYLSRQGEPIDAGDLEAMHDRLGHLAEVEETAPACPDDWGALRIKPEEIELWSESPDRLHDRRLFTRSGDSWELQLLSP